MGTISARKRKDGSVAYRARVRVMQDGVAYHETETFDSRPAATAWISKREPERTATCKSGVSIEYDTTTLVLNRCLSRQLQTNAGLLLIVTGQLPFPMICVCTMDRDRSPRQLLARRHQQQ